MNGSIAVKLRHGGLDLDSIPPCEIYTPLPPPCTPATGRLRICTYPYVMFTCLVSWGCGNCFSNCFSSHRTPPLPNFLRPRCASVVWRNSLRTCYHATKSERDRSSLIRGSNRVRQSHALAQRQGLAP